jgi:HAD superfamily hydrolase (TIGR01450 family)
MLLDLDGTLCVGDDALPGARELMTWLNEANLPHAVVSNTTRSGRQIAERLRRNNLPLAPIFTAADAACRHVGDRRVFNLCGDGITDNLPPRQLTELNAPADAVIVGTPRDPAASIERQQWALKLLLDGAELVGTCDDRTYPSPRGLEIGAGPLTRQLAHAADVQPIFCGKPEPWFFRAALRHLDLRPGRAVWMVGDNPESDIAGGRAAGLSTCLIRTGLQADAEADATFADLSALLTALQSNTAGTASAS